MKSLSVLFVILALMVGVSFADSSPTASTNTPTLRDRLLAGDLAKENINITLEQAQEADLLQSDLLWKSQFLGGGGGGGE